MHLQDNQARLRKKKQKMIRRMIASENYYPNRMGEMERECSFYVDQMYAAKNGILRKAFGKMAIIYFKRYEYYLKKCTSNEPGKSI